MVFSSEIITDIITYINKDLSYTPFCTAVRGYDTDSLPLPLRTTYLSFVPDEYNFSYYEDSTTPLCEKDTITIRLNCFAPLRRKPTASHALVEAVLDEVKDNFGTNLTKFTIGKTEFDDDVNAYKITCYLEFVYERSVETTE